MRRLLSIAFAAVALATLSVSAFAAPAVDLPVNQELSMSSKAHTIDTFIPSADIGPYLIAASTTSDKVKPATAATDNLLAAVDNLGAKAGEACGIPLSGVGEVALGGTVANGDPLTADGNSKAIKCVAAASTLKRIIGYALQQGDSGDIIRYRIAPGMLTLGAAS